MTASSIDVERSGRGTLTGSHRRSAVTTLKTLGALSLLLAALPFNLALTVSALVRSIFVASPRAKASAPKTIMVSGGKMTKSLQLARSFHSAGHRVILIESGKYWLTGHRFSRAVDRFYCVPSPQSDGYTDALLQIVRAESVDVYVPVCSPVASYHDAVAKTALSEYCEVLHCDPDMITTLDDKYQFSTMAASLGLTVPDSHLITAPEQVMDFEFRQDRPPYILKSIPYDPVHRLDLTPLPRASSAETLMFLDTRSITTETPWIMQSFVRGQEYCTHSTVRDGQVQVYCCCTSSAFQINYEMVDKPEIEAWVRKFVGALKLTGQVSFDFIESDDGQIYAIECNPRTHSAITMFYNHPDLARAYLERNVPTVRPLDTSRATYWMYHELWRLLRHPSTAAHRLRTILQGKDAIFDWSDPLPFLMVHHAQIPWLLIQNLRHGKEWMRIDFNIGKLVEPAGD